MIAVAVGRELSVSTVKALCIDLIVLPLLALLMLVWTLPFASFSLAVNRDDDDDDDLTLVLLRLTLLLSSVLLLRRELVVVVEVIVAVEVAVEVAVKAAPLRDDAGDGLDDGAADAVSDRTGFSAERLLASKLDNDTLRSLDAGFIGAGSGVVDFA